MNTAQEKLQKAFAFAMENRPKVGGFPFLAECLKQAGVINNTWTLPSTQSIYVMLDGIVVNQGTPLVTGMEDVPTFNKEKLQLVFLECRSALRLGARHSAPNS